jgi:hypothetical protein
LLLIWQCPVMNSALYISPPHPSSLQQARLLLLHVAVALPLLLLLLQQQNLAGSQAGSQPG